MQSLGIRREDKTEQERRAPLAPKHVKTLIEEHGIQVFVESNPRRVFTEASSQKRHPPDLLQYADAPAYS